MKWTYRYAGETKAQAPYRHPVTGTGLCGKAGGCTDCGAMLPAVQRANTSPIHVEGESHEAFIDRTNGMINDIGELNKHLCDRSHGDSTVSHGHIQHMAGMGDLNMGRIKQAQGLATAMGGVQNVPASVQQAQNTAFLASAPEQMQGYTGGTNGSDGKGSFDTAPWLGSGVGGLNAIGAH